MKKQFYSPLLSKVPIGVKTLLFAFLLLLFSNGVMAQSYTTFTSANHDNYSGIVKNWVTDCTINGPTPLSFSGGTSDAGKPSGSSSNNNGIYSSKGTVSAATAGNSVFAGSGTQGQTYTIVVKKPANQTYEGYVNCFIDYNDNGSFNDAGEQIIGTSTTNQSGGILIAGNNSATTATGTFTVPLAAPVGLHRLRVIIVCGSGTCGGAYTTNSTGFGDAKDFDFTVLSACTQPATGATSFTSSSLVPGAGTATIGFTRGSGDGGVVVIARDGAADTGPTNGSTYTGNAAMGSGSVVGGGFAVFAETGSGSGTRSINLTNLTSGHQYYFGVYEYNATSTCYVLAPLSSGFCFGAPASATVTSSSNPQCPAGSTLGLTGLAAGGFYTFDWQASATSGSGYADPSGGSNTSSTYTTPATLPSAPTYYVCQVTCPNTSNTTQSTQLSQSANSFLSCYCQYGGFSATSSPATYVSNITLNGNSVNLGNSPTGYTPTTGTYNLYTTYVPDLSQGSPYTLKVTNGTSTRRNNVAAWIDWNQNGQFGDVANEYLGTYTQYGASVQELFAFTCPVTSLQGTTAMRVVYSNTNAVTTGFSNTTGQANACTFAAGPGETFDMRVIVSGCTTPTTQASAFVTDPSPTTTSCSVKFTRGSGDGGMLVVCKAGSAPTGPTPGTSYASPNANITAGGSTTAAGSFVIYNSATGSSGTQITVPATNLTPNTTYYFAAYEWNSASTCYQLTTPPNGTCVIPLCIQPTTQVTGVTVPTINTTDATINWTAGNGNKTLIILRSGSAVNGAPALTTTYTDNLNFNFGAPSGSSLGSGNVMFGDGGADAAATATITGLLPSTTYYYAMYTYFSSSHCYYLTSPATGNFTTASCSPSTQPSGAAICMDYTTGTLTFNRGNGTNVIVVAHAGSAVNSTPVYNTSYTANTAFGSGSQIGTGNYVVYNGSDAGLVTVSLTNLAQGTTYYFSIYEYNASPNCYNYVGPATTNSTTRNAGTYTSSTTTQNSTTIEQNSLGQQIIGLQIVVGGGQEQAAVLNNIIFNTTGSTNTATDLINAKIYYTGTSSTFAKTTQYGATFTSFSGNLTAAASFALATGTNYFWVAVDMNLTASVSNVVDAQIVSINLTDYSGTSDRTPSITNPSGSRAIVVPSVLPIAASCTPSHNNTYGDACYGVSLNGVNYPGGGANYNNNTASTPAYLTPGQTYALSGSFDNLWDAIFMWIDWNQNGTFATSERIIDGGYSANVNITVPLDAVPGPCRMRFNMGDTNPGGTGPCTGSNGSSTSGYCLDYTVVVGSGGGGTQAVSCATTAPTITTPVAYTKNATASQLTAAGTSLLWYTAVTGGTGSATAPTPTTTAGGTTAYYVSQNTGCESPRTQIAVVVTNPSCCTAPTTQATNFSSNSVDPSGGTCNVTFTRGSGSGGYIIVAHDNGAVGSVPASGTVYTAGAFGSGQTTGTGDYVVYTSSTPGDGSSAESAAITGLTQGHTYSFKVYEYNAGSTCYMLPGLSGSVYLAPACSGSPNAGTATAVSSSFCPNGSTTINLTSYDNQVSGITFQWQVSTNGGSSYSNVSGGSGATTISYTTPGLANTTTSNKLYYYQCVVTCTNSSTSAPSNPAIITVTPAVATATANGSTGTIVSCNNADVQLSTPAGATSYTWSPSVGLENSYTNIYNPTANPTVTTTYTVTTMWGSCPANSSVTITIYPGTVTFSPSAPSVSLGTGVSVTSSATSGNGGVTYSWLPADGTLSAQSGATVTATPLTTTTYTATATDALGCSRTGTVTVTVRSGSSGAVGCGYSYSSSGSGWNDISGSGAVVGSAGNNNYTIDLSGLATPFTFDYNGITYSQFGVSGYGYIYFGANSPSSGNKTPISSSDTYDGAVAAWADNISGSNCIYYLVSGTAPNRTLTVQYGKTVGGGVSNAFSAGGASIGFEIVLYEHGGTSSDVIALAYSTQNNELIGGGNNISSAQVGLRGAANTDFNNRTSVNTNVTSGSTSAGGSNSAAVTITGSKWINFDGSFIYTPTIATPTITPTGQQNICTGQSGVTFTGHSSLPASPTTWAWQNFATHAAAPGTSNASTYLANPASAGNWFYAVSVSDGSGCSRTSSAAAVVATACCINGGITGVSKGSCPSGNPASMTANGVTGTNAVVNWFTGWNGTAGTGGSLHTGSTYTATATGTYYAVVTADCGAAVEAHTTVTATACSFNYTVTAQLQGYYLGGSMSPLLYLLGISVISTEVDTVTIELYGATGSHALVESHKGVLQTNGTVAVSLTNSGTYYVVIKHRNSITTWSASAVIVDASHTSYNFTTPGNALGAMADLGGGVYGIYSGDIVRNFESADKIDAADKTSMQSVLSIFTIGVYDPNDITGDGFVDEDDYRILQNNLDVGVSGQHP